MFIKKRLKKFKLILEYDGTFFFGWQTQPGLRTVQDELEKALYKLLKKKCRVTGASRTDAGVHALGQVAAFQAKTQLTEKNLLAALASLLPTDVSVKKAEECPLSFDPREDATGKTYRYTLLNAKIPSVFKRHTSLLVRTPLHLSKMRQAARALQGKKDFASFQTSARDGNRRKFTKTNLFKIRVRRKGPVFTVHIFGKNFLYKMCRTIVGTLIAVGKGKMRPEDIKKILASKNRSLAGPTAPAHGLCLIKVHY